jgi:hypothetical protein
MKDPTQPRNPIAEIDFLEVAKIAAMIPTPGLSARKKIQEALVLLNVARKLQDDARERNLCPFSVLKEWDAYDEDIRNGVVEPEDPDEHPLYKDCRAFQKIGPDGKPLPLTFQDGLAKMMPQVEKLDLREARFLAYLQDCGSKFGRSFSKETAENEIRAWKQQGFQWSPFEYNFVTFRLWWEGQSALIKSKARLGKTKGKQGRVVRRNDKRKGSKAGSFLKALKKNP